MSDSITRCWDKYISEVETLKQLKASHANSQFSRASAMYHAEERRIESQKERVNSAYYWYQANGGTKKRVSTVAQKQKSANDLSGYVYVPQLRWYAKTSKGTIGYWEKRGFRCYLEFCDKKTGKDWIIMVDNGNMHAVAVSSRR